MLNFQPLLMNRNSSKNLEQNLFEIEICSKCLYCQFINCQNLSINVSLLNKCIIIINFFFAISCPIF